MQIHTKLPNFLENLVMSRLRVSGLNLNKVLLELGYIICLHIVYEYFKLIIVQLRRCYEEHMAYKC